MPSTTPPTHAVLPPRIGAVADWPEFFEVTSQPAVKMLGNLRVLHYLRPFLQGAQTLTSAAATIHKPASTVAYWIPRLLAVGLIEHLGDQSRNGMAMPIYRAPARRLTVPFDKLPFDSRIELLDVGRMRVLRRFLDGLDEALEAEHSFSLAFYPGQNDGFAVEMIESSSSREARGFTDGWMAFKLTPEDARSMSHELEAVMERYASKEGPRRYIGHAGLAPDPRHRWRSAGDGDPI